MKKTIDVEKLLAWAQPNMRRESVFLYPRPQVNLEVRADEFWEFVMKEAEMTPDDLNATLDRLFPEKTNA